MAEEKDLIIIIFLMMLVTVIPRVLPLLIDNNKWPKWIEESLEFLPVAIVTSVVVPGIIFNSFSSYFITTEFITSILTIIFILISRNLIVTVILALITYYILDTYIF